MLMFMKLGDVNFSCICISHFSYAEFMKYKVQQKKVLTKKRTFIKTDNNGLYDYLLDVMKIATVCGATDSRREKKSPWSKKMSTSEEAVREWFQQFLPKTDNKSTNSILQPLVERQENILQPVKNAVPGYCNGSKNNNDLHTKISELERENSSLRDLFIIFMPELFFFEKKLKNKTLKKKMRGHRHKIMRKNGWKWLQKITNWSKNCEIISKLLQQNMQLMNDTNDLKQRLQNKSNNLFSSASTIEILKPKKLENENPSENGISPGTRSHSLFGPDLKAPKTLEKPIDKQITDPQKETIVWSTKHFELSTHKETETNTSFGNTPLFVFPKKSTASSDNKRLSSSGRAKSSPPQLASNNNNHRFSASAQTLPSSMREQNNDHFGEEFFCSIGKVCLLLLLFIYLFIFFWKGYVMAKTFGDIMTPVTAISNKSKNNEACNLTVISPLVPVDLLAVAQNTSLNEKAAMEVDNVPKITRFASNAHFTPGQVQRNEAPTETKNQNTNMAETAVVQTDLSPPQVNITESNDPKEATEVVNQNNDSIFDRPLSWCFFIQVKKNVAILI
ncbi:hypothetical protein RFI_19399 [Reticulomyxa filosa]|uniref:Uncharacterized protein n=1 Tax=Reticulomyxa filosa TaxID=46433 RepID=X6MVA5_RETFI|nr:hypothetical protein RFI_19399 [Reticulomyxa filosa]|eukprot:ETO17908.1 hypothetical protein RFI_19399 [Reticulomyxa filosa]